MNSGPTLKSPWYLSADGWLWLVCVMTVVCMVSLVLSDVLPPTVEEVVRWVCLLVYGGTVVGTGVWGLAAAIRWLSCSPWTIRWRFLAASAACAVLLSVVTFSAGARSAFVLLSIAILLTMPFASVRFGKSPRSGWRAAGRGIAAAISSGIFCLILYAILFGIEGGYMVGQIGPGLKGLPSLQILLFFYTLVVWPVAVPMVVGAVGGIVGWSGRPDRASCSS